MSDTLHVTNYEVPDEKQVRRKTRDPELEARVRRNVYAHMSWSTPYVDEPRRRESNNEKCPEHSFDQAFDQKIQRSVIGQFLEDTKMPANR